MTSETEDIVTRLEQYRNGMWPVHECLRLADAWTTGVDLDDLPQWRIVVAVLAQEVREAATTIATLRAEVEGLRADAERYRWLKHKAPGEIVFDHINDDHRFELYVPFDGNPIDNDEESNARLDAAIDAAKAGKEGIG